MQHPLIRLAGGLLALAGIAFLGYQVWLLRVELAQILAEPRLLACVVLGSLIYGAALFLLAYGWAGVLTGRRGPLTAELLRIFSMSSIAKYLPGNVLHFAGRQVMVAGLGFSQVEIARATLAESLLTLAAALSLAALIWAGVLVPWAAPLLAILFGAVFLIRRADPMTRMFALGCVFFAINVALLAAVIASMTGLQAAFLELGVAYLIAWSAGNLLPGAPGGLGVREAAFVALASSLFAETGPVVIAAALAMRLVTLIGDAVFFGAGTLLDKSGTTPAENV